MDHVYITLVEDENLATDEEVERGIIRRRTLWAGYVPINGQVSVALPAHETLRPYSNLTTVLAIQAHQPASRASGR